MTSALVKGINRSLRVEAATALSYSQLMGLPLLHGIDAFICSDFFVCIKSGAVNRIVNDAKRINRTLNTLH
jgi:hypothetical protein